jgi:hypothetical protein
MEKKKICDKEWGKGMSRLSRHWVFAGIALVVLVLLWHWLSREQAASLPAFGIGIEQEVVRVELEGGPDGKLVLEKHADASWRLNKAHEASAPAVRELLAVLGEMTVRRPVPLDSRQEMDGYFKDHGIGVRVYVSAHRIRLPFGIRLFPFIKLVRFIEVGPNAPDGGGTAMQQAGEDVYYWVHLPGTQAGLRQVFSAGEDHYRSPLLFGLERGDIRAVSVRIPDQLEMSYVIEVQSEGRIALLLHDGRKISPEQLNIVRLQRFVRAFEGLYFDRPVGGAESDKRMAMMVPGPFMVLEISTNDGDQYVLECYRRLPPPEINMDPATDVEYDPDRFYILTGDGEYLLAHYYFFSHVLRPVSFFLEE